MQPIAGVRAAAGDDEPAHVERTHADTHRRSPLRLTIGAAPLTGVVAQTADRHQNHAEHRHMVFDQRDVDGELAVALTTSRVPSSIDQPEAPARPLLVRYGRLLRQHRQTRCHCSQTALDGFMRGHVGFGQRRLVFLRR